MSRKSENHLSLSSVYSFVDDFSYVVRICHLDIPFQNQPAFLNPIFLSFFNTTFSEKKSFNNIC